MKDSCKMCKNPARKGPFSKQKRFCKILARCLQDYCTRFVQETCTILHGISSWVMASSLRICYSKKGLSTAPWSFFLSVAPFFLFYSLIKGEKLNCNASDYFTQKQLLTHMNIIMKYAPMFSHVCLCFFTSSVSK